MPPPPPGSSAADSSTRSAGWNAKQLACLCAAFAALALMGFGFTLNDFFLSDDFAGLAMASQATSIWEASSPGDNFSQRWLRPLPNWLWWINYSAGGLDPFGYRLSNLVLHALNGILLALLAARLLRHRPAGVFAGALFLVLPIHPEAVTWISARFDLLCTLGMLGALLTWTHYLGERGSAAHLGLALLGTAIALASKEMALTLPLLCAAVGLGFFRPLPRRAWGGLLAIVSLVGIYLVLRLDLLSGMGGIVNENGNMTTSIRGARLSFLFDAVTMSLVPTLRMHFPPALVVVQALPPLLLGAGFWIAARSGNGLRPLLRTGALCALLFALALIPVVGWATLWGGHSTRYLYFPSGFACTAVALWMVHLPAAWLLRGRVLAAGLLACSLSGQVILNGHWHAAANQAERIVDTFPLEGTESKAKLFMVTGVPAFHGDAHLFFNGLREALRLFRKYPGRLRVLPRENWEAQRSTFQGSNSEQAFLSWTSTEEDWDLR